MGIRPDKPTLGIIIPCYNEEAVLPHLFRELSRLADTLGLPIRVLFIDDGSRDRTFELLAEASSKDERFACLRFSRNFGHPTAVAAGLRHVRGDVVAVLDADLQDPPELLGDMLAKWREGYDVVYGVRKNRKEGFLLRLAFAAFYRMLKTLSRVDMPVDAGDFSLMDRRVVDCIRHMPEHEPFVRGLRSWVGFKQIGVPYDRPARAAGTTKMNIGRRMNFAIHAFVSFSSVPLRVASWLGVAASAAGFVLMIWAIVSRFMDKVVSGWASLAVMMLFFGGVQLIVLGIIGEYVGRIFEEVKSRPHFVISESAGWVELGDAREGKPITA